MGILKWQERSPRNLVTAHLSPPPPHMQFKKQNVKKDIHVLLRVCVERGTRIALHSLLLQPCKQVAPRAETPGTDSPTAPGFQTLPGGKRGLRQTPPTHTLPKTPRPFHEDLPPGILDPADLSLYRQARRGKPGRRGHPFRSVPFRSTRERRALPPAPGGRQPSPPRRRLRLRPRSRTHVVPHPKVTGTAGTRTKRSPPPSEPLPTAAPLSPAARSLPGFFFPGSRRDAASLPSPHRSMGSPVRHR